jgi:hypothetical protein
MQREVAYASGRAGAFRRRLAARLAVLDELLDA